jgi:predicted RNA binding protein YcfA (HicA-like mRNA interferase family)
VTKLPRGLSGKAVVKALQRTNFYIKRRKGSHIVLRRENPFTQVVVPDHKILDTGTLDSIIYQAGLSIDEFISLL